MNADRKIKSSLRLTFSYERTNVQLTNVQRVMMRPLPADPLQTPKDATGFWIELQDANGQSLYRRVMQNPIRFAAEFPTGDPDRPLAWGNIDEPRGSFVLVVPDLPRVTTLVLFSSPLEPDRNTAPAQELIRFDLNQFTQKKEA